MQDAQVWGIGEKSFDFALDAISQIPESLLRAELKRRNGNFIRDENDDDRSSCGSGQRGTYNTPLHVMALFLILVLSTFACSFPVLARRFPRLPIPRRFLFISRHFGTGVLIATAFVHLLPTAFMSLTDPCLPRFWSQSYRAMAGFVAMMSVFAVVLVEMFFAMKGAGHVHGNDYDTLMGRESLENFRHDIQDHTDGQFHSRNPSGNIRMEGLRQNDPASSHESDQHIVGSQSDKEEDDDADIDGLDDYADDVPINGQPRSSMHSAHRHRPRLSEHFHSQAGSEAPMQNPQRQLLQCLLLEAGILFHSIFIGMALSVATGTSFVVLLIAISFHQTFEGFALGSRIASLIPDLFGPSSMKPWLMSLAYGTTTPLGQAIGLILHNMYDPASATGLLMVGITNAISSGLLLFAGLVELLAEDFLSESSYETLQGRRRFEACVSVACGAILMALVGAFA
ncbi:Zinc/iron permease [Penicillium citrinum]|uniref:Zinc/iron permease n=2 Tax=Penicillium TaxID=5073 RepID=A0A9W9PD35_PENCI|nr:Zinc/iron permease [Penicillium citrinum]KAJ5242360.1 Zinc/iron permease [Penicillium citrinum]KAJ5600139.1 Zinc/iron permease [Penicillium hetheringtonii]